MTRNNAQLSTEEKEQLQSWQQKKSQQVEELKRKRAEVKNDKVKILGIDARIIYGAIFVIAGAGFYFDSQRDGNYFKFFLYSLGTGIILAIGYYVAKMAQRIGK